MRNVVLSVSFTGGKTDYDINFEGVPKFIDDHIYSEKHDLLVYFDGVVLNKNQLLKTHGSKSWLECVKYLYDKTGRRFFEVLRGSFFGIIYDKRINKWLIFSDHIGSKKVFYFALENKIIISNSYSSLVNLLQKQGFALDFNFDSVCKFLGYGYVFGENTILSNIKRLEVGSYLVWEKGAIRKEKFYAIDNDPIDIDFEKAINELDLRFREAVKLAFRKDKEYSLKHLVSLSGGLDSRMTSWVAHEMGFRDQLNITFSKSNYLDEVIAKEIASDLKHEWMFKALDNGSYLMSIDTMNKITGGNVSYAGSAQTLWMFKQINFDSVGLLHTGQLGDVIIGTYASTNSYASKFDYGVKSINKVVQSYIDDQNLNYPNEELYKMNVRGFYGINQGLSATQKFTETYSPFYNIDVLSYALKLPLDYRLNHRLCKSWILNKYPKASKYKWERTNSKINEKSYNVLGKSINKTKVLSLLKSKFSLTKNPLETKNHMNPLDYWYNKNYDLQCYINSYFYTEIEKMSNSNVKELCQDIYLRGNFSDKAKAITVLSVNKNFINRK